MGYMVEIGVLMDSWDQIRRHPKRWVRRLEQAINAHQRGHDAP